ncbi:MAG: group II intron reverse transcriptase/maturase [Acidobacteriota bacterium]
MVEQSRETPAEHGSGEPVETKLLRIAAKARKERKLKFVNLYHLMNEEMLLECFKRLSANKAAGIDEVTKGEYGENLEANIRELVGRLHRMAYRPRPVRRVYIPKPGSDKRRPLGIPSLEDKLVQSALARILGAIYEEDFTEDSYGFRPGRSCHDALRALSQAVEWESTNYIAEADIKGFFDNVDHDWMMKMLEHRIADKRVLRMVKRFLKSGVMEEAEMRASEEGVPQGGSISPLLSNVYLHYALDLWFEKGYRRSCKGKARLIRFADDFVACFQNREDAKRFQAALVERLNKFGLEVEPTKTKVLEFGRDAEGHARARGGKPETFDFLGFTHYCSRTRDGNRYRMKRVTARKKFRAKLATFKEWLKRNRIMPTQWIMQKVGLKLRGHYAYYGVTDNYRGVARYHREVTKMLFKWLNRRSQRRSYKWEEFERLLQIFPLPRPRVRVDLFYRARMTV